MTELQKQKQRKENVLKLKKIGFWTINIISYICAFLFVLLLIISLVSPKQSNNGTSPRNIRRSFVNDIVLVEDSPNNVSYDDVSYEISFTDDELNDYSWENLSTYLSDNIATLYPSANSLSIDYDSSSYSYNTYGGEYLLFLSNDYNGIKLNFSTFEWTFIDSSNNVLPFNDGFVITLNSTWYEGFKSAVELDIQANDSNINPTPSIFESITQVITNFISTLNEGVENVIELFWDSENLSLTMLGNLTTIVVGVAVCFFLFRLLIGLIRLRG